MALGVVGPERRVGAWEGDRVIDLQRADPALPSDLEAFIALGARGIETAQRAIARAGDGSAQPRADVLLHAPAVRPPRLPRAAGDYAADPPGSPARKGSSPPLAHPAPAGATLTAAAGRAKTRATH